MNGAVYISFFQGQLESVLEQVVQLAVQEISKTVGSSLNALLLETAVKEQENHRLRVQLQSGESRGRAGASCSAPGGGSPVAGRTKAGRAAGDEAPEGGRTKPGGQGAEPGAPTDTRRLEQRGRVVDQMKSVMEQVLNFAVRELTKIVEASYDDLLLEITKMEREHQALEERLDRSADKGGGASEKGRGARRRGSENDSVSPSGSEDTREEPAEVPESKEPAEKEDPEHPPVIAVSQDWFPILDKVFGQKWCSDVWQIKELAGAGRGGRDVSEGGVEQMKPPPDPSVTLEPSPSSPQQDPRWTPLEDMEVFSPDGDATDGQLSARGRDDPAPTGPPPSPPGEGGHFIDRPAAHFSGSSGRRSSASMLHRLLTLPSQLLEEEEEDAGAKETLAALAQDDCDTPGRTCPSPLTTREEEGEEDEEEEEEEDRGRKKKRRRVWSECDECGRRFSRMSLLKAHRQTHFTEGAGADTASPSSPPDGTASALRCSDCGKRFSSTTRLHSHVRTQHPGNRA